MIVSHLIAAADIILFRILASRENQRRDRLLAEAGVERNLNETAFADMTDRENPNFRYVY